MSDQAIDYIGKSYSYGNMSIDDIAVLTRLSRAHVNWAVDEYARRKRAIPTRESRVN